MCTPLQCPKLPRPDWMFMNDDGDDELDALAQIYDDICLLTKEGHICYASIVAANNLLYKRFPLWDAPGYIVYSLDPFVNEHPDILDEAGDEIFSHVGIYEYAPEKCKSTFILPKDYWTFTFSSMFW